MEQIRVAVAGFGGMGRLYSDCIAEGKIPSLRLTGVCCRNHTGQKYILEHYKDVAVYADADDMFAHFRDFDALIIAVPHKEHIPYLEQALTRGIHVLCEKPLAVSLAETAKIRQMQLDNTAFAMVFNWRARPLYRKLKEMLDSGCLGSLTHIVWIANFWYRAPFYHSMAAWRSSWQGEGGGLLINQMQHIFDLWQWLFGMPDSVLARVEFGKFNPITTDDSSDLVFSYQNGLRGVCVTASGESPGSNYLEIHGTCGKIVATGEELTLFQNEVSTQEFAARTDGVFTGIPCQKKTISIQASLAEHEEYSIVLQNFAEHILKKTPLLARGLEGEKALEIANGAYLSAWLNCEIHYPIDQNRYNQMLLKRIEAEKEADG